ncbi:hypothetical protein V4D09_18905 [Vibrio mimicus]|uniref:hypothetical protein n=1 Tax=Vibrio mimicus TaxID=674 RepID=UPI002F95317C
MKVLGKYINTQGHDFDPEWTKIIPNYEILPSEYLNFSYADFKGGDTRSYINALSNAKKAMHLQTEILAEQLGYRKISKKPNFPSMLDFLTSCGVITALVLNKVNSVRNKSEHDYLIPDKDQVSVFIDAVKLYLGATDNLVHRFPSNVIFPDTLNEENEAVKGLFNVRLVPVEGKVVLKYCLSDEYVDKTVNVGEPEYFAWVNFLLNVSK